MNFTNSPLVTYTNITKNKTEGRSHEIDTITIHCAVGQCTAKEGCDYFARTSRQVSSNYYIGYDGSIGLSVEEKDRAWTSGGKDKNGNPIRINGISGADNDHRAITIEVASSAQAPYSITKKAYEALVNLVADICKRNGIKELKWKANKSLVGKIEEQNMTVHRWFASTSCPGSYIYQRLSDIAQEVNLLLNSTKDTAQKYDISLGERLSLADAKIILERIKADGFSKAIIVKAVAAEQAESSDDMNKSTNIIKVGSTVKIKQGAKTYTGGNLAAFVYKRDYKVKEIKDKRVVVTLNDVVVAAINCEDLILIS